MTTIIASILILISALLAIYFILNFCFFISILSSLLRLHRVVVFCLKRQIKISERVNGMFSKVLAYQYLTIAKSLAELREFDEALEYAYKALETNKMVEGDSSLEIVYNYATIGDIYYLRGDFKKALDSFLTALDIVHLNDTYGDYRDFKIKILFGRKVQYRLLYSIFTKIGDIYKLFKRQDLASEYYLYGKYIEQIYIK